MGMKQYRFELMKEFDNLIEEKEVGEAKEKLEKLLKYSYPDLKEEDEKEIRELAEEKEKEKKKREVKVLKESEEKGSVYKKRKHLLTGVFEVRKECLLDVKDELSDLLIENELVPKE